MSDLVRVNFLSPPCTASDRLDAFMFGAKRSGFPSGYPNAYTPVKLVETSYMNVRDAERLLRFFIDMIFTDTDENEAVKAVARDILDNPEKAHRHYTTFKLKKKDGGFRTIEAPERHLKALQRAILNNWLYARRKPAFCVQGFVPGRGTLTNAKLHVADGILGRNKTLIKVDIRDFFMSITRTSLMNQILNKLGFWINHSDATRKFPRILMRMFEEHRVDMPTMVDNVLLRFKEEGVCYKEYPEHAAAVVSCQVLLDWILIRLCYLDERLPQGSPCSPALANMFMTSFNNMLRLDFGKKLSQGSGWESTIYADDSTTTLGPFATDEDVRLARSIVVGNIMRYPDISVNYRKIGVFRHGHPQKITGIMITDKISISRQERDKVRAELHNAATGKKVLTEQDKMRLRGVRAWMRGVDPAGWDSRCEPDYRKVVEP